jgi:dolichyl-phosphate-mannose-protein mannosyltransferase
MRRRPILLLLTLVAGGLALRLWWSGAFLDQPGWIDPDRYVLMARALGDGRRPWRWTAEAVHYYEFVKAPLYQLALSALTSRPQTFPFPHAAIIGHAVLSSLAIIAVYFAATALHNGRAGLIAATVYALWAPNILNTPTFWQEQLFLPLFVTALALLGRAIDRDKPARYWAAVGLVFGLAALARSAVAYFVLPATILYAIGSGPGGVQRAGGLLGGFALVTLPYTLYISEVSGRFVFIENVGFYSLKRFNPASLVNPSVTLTAQMADPSGPPSSGEVVRFLWSDLVGDPAGFLLRVFDYVRLLLKPAGAALLRTLVAGDARTAAWLKLAVHSALDVPFIMVVILAPIGAAFSRQRRFALLLSLWVVLYLAMLSLTLWAGTRYRSPIEPALIILAATVLAGGWQRPSPATATVAAVMAAAAAGIIAMNLGSIVTARTNYGVDHWPAISDETARFEGAAGVNVIQSETLAFMLDSATPNQSTEIVTVKVAIDGRQANQFSMTTAEPKHLRYPLKQPGAYLELTAQTADGRPAVMRLRME